MMTRGEIKSSQAASRENFSQATEVWKSGKLKKHGVWNRRSAL